MADPMKIRANVSGDSTEVKVLMNHEMETGQRKDAAGKTIPAWFIQDVSAAHNGKTVMTAQWGPSVAKNPFLQFSVKPGFIDHPPHPPSVTLISFCANSTLPSRISATA